MLTLHETSMDRPHIRRGMGGRYLCYGRRRETCCPVEEAGWEPVGPTGLGVDPLQAYTNWQREVLRYMPSMHLVYFAGVPDPVLTE